MSVTLEPAELGFSRPFTYGEVKQSLRLSNGNSSEPVAFKVKTTAPKQYCVRPNSGRIEPGQTVEVSVLLQQMKEDPPLDARCRDKFLVQSVPIPAGQDTGTVTQIWSNIEATAKSSIQERKIRVNFLPADGSHVAEGANGLSVIDESLHSDQPPAYSSPAPARSSPVATNTAVTAPSSHSDGKSTADGPVTATLASAIPAVSSATGISQADLQRNLDEANATIKRLQNQVTEGLRQRNVIGGKSSDEKSVAGVTATKLQQAPPAGGVSVPIVALLCFVIFLITYLFL